MKKQFKNRKKTVRQQKILWRFYEKKREVANETNNIARVG